jgi:hypothetical protein
MENFVDWSAAGRSNLADAISSRAFGCLQSRLHSGENLFAVLIFETGGQRHY